MTENLPSRVVRAAGCFILDLFGAVLVPAMLEGSIWRALPVHTPTGVVVKVWSLDLATAAFVGFMMYRVWRSGTSKWVWIVPALWFALRALPFAAHSQARSVLWTNETFWAHFLGGSCASRAMDCGDFFAFTVPFIRSLSYSLAATVASRVLNPLPADPDLDHATKTERNQ